MLIPLGLRDNTSNTAYPSATRTPPSPQRFYNTNYPTTPLYNTAYHITAQTPRLTNSATQTPPTIALFNYCLLQRRSQLTTAPLEHRVRLPERHSVKTTLTLQR